MIDFSKFPIGPIVRAHSIRVECDYCADLGIGGEGSSFELPDDGTTHLGDFLDWAQIHYDTGHLADEIETERQQ